MIKVLFCALLLWCLTASGFAQLRVAVGDDVFISNRPNSVEPCTCQNPRVQGECEYNVHAPSNMLIPFYVTDSSTIRFKADGVGNYIDTAYFWYEKYYSGCEFSGFYQCYGCQSHTEKEAFAVNTFFDNKVKMYSHYYNPSIYGKAVDSAVVFVYDTAKKKYSAAVSKIEIYNNKNMNVVFDNWTLSLDSSQSLSFELEQDSIPVNSVAVAADKVAKNVLLDFTTTLVPLLPWRSFPGIVQCTAHFGGKDSLCSIPLVFMFQEMPRSGIPTSVEKINELEIFPNPVIGSAHAFCVLQEASQLHLHIFDELGKDVLPVYDGWLQAGPRLFTFKLPQGMYYVRMETAERVVTKEIIVE